MLLREDKLPFRLNFLLIYGSKHFLSVAKATLDLALSVCLSICLSVFNGISIKSHQSKSSIHFNNQSTLIIIQLFNLSLTLKHLLLVFIIRDDYCNSLVNRTEQSRLTKWFARVQNLVS